MARGDITGAVGIVEAAMVDATPESRVDLELARSWLDEIVPQRDSSIGIA